MAFNIIGGINLTTHGELVHKNIEFIQDLVTVEGDPVIVDGMGTVEILNKEFTLTFSDKIDMISIDSEMNNYYKDRELDLAELQELEKDEYQKIIDEFIGNKFEFFNKDLYSRRVLWTDDCCISMVHFLIRDGIINCFVHLRSSDVIYKLFSDVRLVLYITSYLQDKLNINFAKINFNAHSFHQVVFKIKEV